MRPLFLHLYTRIWLAFFAVIVLMLLLLAGLWIYKEVHEQEREHERVLIVRNADGEALFSAPVVPMMGSPEHGMIFEAQLSEATSLGDVVYIQLPPMQGPASLAWLGGGKGNSAKLVLWFLVLLGLGVAAATYPLIRRLTKRLELLQKEVSVWGAGNLSQRAAIQGHDEVAQLARRFNEAAERIEKLVQSQKSLLANASHELRSPLARIKMGLELAPELANSGLRQELDLNLQELDQLIDEILWTSRLDSGEEEVTQQQRMSFEVVDFSGLVQDELGNAVTDLELDTRLSVSTLSVYGNPILLRRLFRNLLQNATRYGRGHAVVELEPANLVAREFEQVLLRVSDTGPGVPTELRQRIFEPFYRLPGAAEHQGGVGLGLALVASIAKLHYGSVACIARPDGLKGACFELRLPLLKSE